MTSFNLMTTQKQMIFNNLLNPKPTIVNQQLIISSTFVLFLWNNTYKKTLSIQYL